MLAAFAGLVQAASFWPWPAWWLQIAALALLVLLVLRAPGRALAAGFAFGFTCFAAGVSWLYVSMHRYGGMPAALAALALLLFAAYLGAFPALACAAFARLSRSASGLALRAGPLGAALRVGASGLLFAGAWALAEMLRGWLFTGFPWLAIGYAQLDGPLAAYAPLVGVYGVCLVAALVAFSLAVAIGALPGASRREAFAMRAFGAAVAAAALGAGVALSAIDWVEPHGAPLRVRLLQGNVPQELKFDPQRSLAAMHAYAEAVLDADVPLTILPETAWTTPWAGTPPPIREALVAHLRRTGTRVAIGMPLPAPAADPHRFAPLSLTNSVGVVDGSGAIAWRYDKRHLVPFGEFVPVGFRWFVDLMRIPLGDFARGANDQEPLSLDGQRIAFDICYEDLFGEELAAQVRGGATILANVSNIAWFGDSHALPQHLQIARMRTLELARPMLRATNTGVTAAIDARGRVLSQLTPYTSGALAVDVQGTAAITPYARFGNPPVVALALACVAVAAIGPRAAMRRRPGRTR